VINFLGKTIRRIVLVAVLLSSLSVTAWAHDPSLSVAEVRISARRSRFIYRLLASTLNAL
jgi:hypothetical protein